MGKKFVLFSCIAFCIFLFNVGKTHAANEIVSDIQDQEVVTTDLKQELGSQRQEIKEQRDQIKGNAQQARAEEKQLREQIKAAMDSGDKETARQLREQLKATHQENVQKMISDKKDIKIDMQDFKNDVQQARQEGNLPPKRYMDNNPPGAKGGPGTNWENPPGPMGGPGAGPDRRPMMDRDNNPPGAKGGPGTNWENPPGPMGGPGAGPDKKPKMNQGGPNMGQKKNSPQGGAPRGGGGRR